MLLGEEINYYWCDGVEDEEEEEGGVDLFGGEDFGWVDEILDDWGGEEDFFFGIVEVFWLGGGVDIGYVVEGVVEGEDLDEVGEGGGYDLGYEYGVGWDFYVVVEFEVGDEGEGLGYGDVVKGFEVV